MSKKPFNQKLKGGLADNKKPSDFDQKQLSKGVKVELEHTKDKNLAKEIAMDHMMEDEKYYTHLNEMEKKYKKAFNLKKFCGSQDIMALLENLEGTKVSIWAKIKEYDGSSLHCILDYGEGCFVKYSFPDCAIPSLIQSGFEKSQMMIYGFDEIGAGFVRVRGILSPEDNNTKNYFTNTLFDKTNGRLPTCYATITFDQLNLDVLKTEEYIEGDEV